MKLLRNARARRVAFQAAFGLVVLLLLNFVIARAFEIGLDYDFLGRRAGFNAEGSTIRDLTRPFDLSEYGASNSYRDAYVLGLLNTIRVALLGIFLATVIGVIAGVARLSKNWLVAHLAAGYVEIFRNTPLVVQLIFWYTAVFLQLPTIADSASLFDIAFLSNRALALPSFGAGDGFVIWALVVVAALVAAVIFRRYRRRRQEERGGELYPGWSALGLFIGLVAVAFVATGLPLSVNLPERGRLSYEGGFQLSPEFAALLIALVLYTGAFIAEIVRGGIQAISKGQTEAAAAVGLNYFQRLQLVILPQAVRIIIPPLTNQYLNLTKNSSLAVAIAFPDIVSVSNTIINQTGEAVSMIALIMVTYLVLSLVISAMMNALNSRLRLATS